MVYSVMALCLHCSTNNLYKLEKTTYNILVILKSKKIKSGVLALHTCVCT